MPRLSAGSRRFASSLPARTQPRPRAYLAVSPASRKRFGAVVERLRLTAREHPAPAVIAAGLRSLGRGVAVTLRSPGLAALHDDLMAAWEPLLIPQDRHRFAGHVTIQNKVDPQVARTTLVTLSATFEPWSFPVVAIDVWRYLGGPWEHLHATALRRATAASQP